MTDLSGLIERVEAAGAEMQAALIEEAWEACAEHSASFRRFACEPCSGFGTNAGKFSAAMEARAFESAALMLVPQGRRMAVQQRRSYEPFWVSFLKDGSTNYDATGRAAKLPLAIVAASLRAQKEQANGRRSDEGDGAAHLCAVHHRQRARRWTG